MDFDGGRFSGFGSSVRERLHLALFLFPALLSRLGVVDREKGEEAFDLAVPVMVTGLIRTVLSVTDFFLVSIAIGTTAVAALEFGFQYYFLGFGLALALASGTISVVARNAGAGDYARVDFAVKQSIWLSLFVSVPITLFTWVHAEPMIALLTSDATAIELGGIYLRIVMLAVAFRFFSIIAWFSLAGVGDTRTPMYVDLLTVPTNIVLSAVLIFGAGPFPELGIAGAAWGTTIASVLSAFVFFVVLASGRFDVQLHLGGSQWETDVAMELLRVGSPLAGLQVVETIGRFPFLWILATLGTPVVAAYAIGNRVMMLAQMPAWGYSTAASTLVGRSLGEGDEHEAADYGWQSVRIALATQLLLAAGIAMLAHPIAVVFSTETPTQTVEFIRVFAVAVAGYSVAATLQGGLRGAGDTTWPFYGVVVGTVASIGIAAVGLPPDVSIDLGGVTISPGLGIGVFAAYVAIISDMYLRAFVNAVRFRSGAWKDVARRSVVRVGGDD